MEEKFLLLHPRMFYSKLDMSSPFTKGKFKWKCIFAFVFIVVLVIDRLSQGQDNGKKNISNFALVSMVVSLEDRLCQIYSLNPSD